MTEIAFTKVRLPYGWLGNMAPYPVMFNDLRWPTTEHLFQALRLPADSRARELIRACKSPMAAKMEAKKHIGQWIVNPRTQADVAHMRMCLKLKLEHHPDVYTMLKQTGDATIIEDCTARPNASGLFWGAARAEKVPGLWDWEGDNVLGHLWMALRAEL